MLPKFLKMKAGVTQRGYLNEQFVKKNNINNRSVIVNELYTSRSLKEALLNHFEFKLEHLLKWNDRNSMAFSIESRTPFLDFRLVEYSLSIEPEFIIKNGTTKSILRDSLKGILPEAIRTRQDKVGFATPQDEWFRLAEFQQLVEDILNSEQLKNRKIIDVDKAKILYEKHLNGKLNISKDIWKWIHLELWFRTYID
jgi:asparagine synthase (glutamine-hydrolysing)